MERSRRPKPTSKQASTSWESVGKWYNASVGEEGHYYHRKIILPGVLRLMDFSQNQNHVSVLDLGCGQGVLARQLPANIPYTGLDASATLVKEAKKTDTNSKHHYILADITKSLPLEKKLFSHAAIILALQNVEHPEYVFKNAAQHLEEQGKFIIILNHPCFRIPRQSSWEVDKAKKIQYRRLDRYGSSLKIPIQAHPSKQEKSATTWSFHHSLAAYSKWLYESGFVIEQLEEWYSDKISEGGAAVMENRSRQEFPLFLAIVATKKTG